MDQDKNKAIINRIIKAGGRLMPGLAPSTSVPDFDSDQQSGEEEDNYVDVMEWWISEEPWKELEHPNADKDDAKAFTQKAENLKRALNVFDRLLCERGTTLQHHIKVLQDVAVKTDKEVKNAGIIGRALGLVAAVGSVVFFPLPRRASLAVAAIGAVAFGVSTTFINKIHIRKKVEKKLETVLKEHFTYIEDIERCVTFIGSNVACLRKYDLSTLKWVKVTRVVQVAGDSVGAIGPLSKSSGLIQGFGLAMDINFIKDDSEQLKKGTETKFAKQITMLATQMQASLDELMKFRKVVESADI